MKGPSSTKAGVGCSKSRIYSKPSKRNQTSCLDISLTKCLQSIQQDVVKSHTAMEAFGAATSRCAMNQSSQLEQGPGPDAEDLSDSATPDSVDTNPTSSLDREVQRLQVLQTYLGVLNEDHGIKFERLTALACRIFRSPMSMVTIADLNKQYCISSRGVDIRSTTSMKLTFCSNTVASDSDLTVVEDSLKDDRFCKDSAVTGFPHVRFYAGAPLVSPHGHRLGTLCVFHTEPRETPVTLDEKQSLIELAAMAMEYLEELRQKKLNACKDPSQQIACTAHDLLTPLTGIALSISLLKEDESLREKLTEQQRDMIETAANCSTVMNSICHKTMNFFRDQERSTETSTSQKPSMRRPGIRRSGVPTVKTKDLVKNLNMVMDPFPKQVPMLITIESDVPEEFISDDMKLFRSASNLLTNACTRTQTGSICMHIKKRVNSESGEREIVFECEDTAPDVDVAIYPFLFKGMRVDGESQGLDGDKISQDPCAQYTGLGLYSVATQIDSMGGKYGFRPRPGASGFESASNECGSVFWFSIPLVLPAELGNPCSSEQGIPDQYFPSGLLASSGGKSTLSEDVAKRLSGLLGIQPPSSIEPKGSFNSLNKLSSEEALAAYASNSQMSNASFGNKRFREPEISKRICQALVIEDSLVVRKNVARVLTKLGFEVTQAVNGMEGLKELKASLFDLVLCDFLMPVMDGLDCIQQYRQWEAINRPFFKQYIVGISAHASDKDMELGFNRGMNEFRSKPLTFKDIEGLKKTEEFKRSRRELDELGHEIDVLKNQKLAPPKPKKHKRAFSFTSSPSDQKVCLVVEVTAVVSQLAEIASTTLGWKIVKVADSESALRLLKMRNWDAVLVDDDPGFSRCISVFREWEKTNRVNRQSNVLLLSGGQGATGDSCTSVKPPTSFDGALPKPIQIDSLEALFKDLKTNWEIVTR